MSFCSSKCTQLGRHEREIYIAASKESKLVTNELPRFVIDYLMTVAA